MQGGNVTTGNSWRATIYKKKEGVSHDRAQYSLILSNTLFSPSASPLPFEVALMTKRAGSTGDPYFHPQVIYATTDVP